MRIHQQLNIAAAKTGVPRAIISYESGSDLHSGIALFKIDITGYGSIDDIKHKTACLAKQVLLE